MSNPYGGPVDWARAIGQRDPFVRWGESVNMTFGSITAPNGVVVIRREFQRVQLPQPIDCQLSLSFSVVPVNDAATAVVDYTAITYSGGIGSSAVRTRRVYKGLPQVRTPTQPNGTPLDVLIELPVHELYAAVEAQAFDCVVTFTLSLAPVSPVYPIGG
jgi:hypothetical protein